MTDVTAEAAPDPSIPEAVLGRRALERLDLLLLTVESLDLNGGEAMLWATRQLGFETIFPNRVELWKRRCHNPLRRSTRRGQLSAVETEALIRILCVMADRLYPMLHQLLSSKEPRELTRQRWELVHQRLRDHRRIVHLLAREHRDRHLPVAARPFLDLLLRSKRSR